MGQVVAFDKFHDEELAFAVGEMIADAWQRSVAEVGQQSRFALEGFEQGLVAEEGFLQSDSAAESKVARQIDGSHPAFPNLLYDLVAPLKNSVGFKHLIASFTS
jgi:hypothetical protein